jgi:hypothetical protein
METHAMAISFFFAVGTAIGGIAGPLLFGRLIESEQVSQAFWDYALGATLMIAAGIVAAFLAVEAAGRDLEDVAKPLSAEQVEGSENARRLGLAPSEVAGPERVRIVADPGRATA